MAGTVKGGGGEDASAAADKRARGGKKVDPTLDRAIQTHIGDRLRTMYGELSDQPLPDRFADILSKLAAK